MSNISVWEGKRIKMEKEPGLETKTEGGKKRLNNDIVQDGWDIYRGECMGRERWREASEERKWVEGGEQGEREGGRQ